MNLQEVLAKNCEMLIPTGWNIYEWAKKHPATTIAAGMRRIEKIFDFSDAINMGFSCGKDSTITSNLALMELNLRRLRVQNGIDRDGNNRIDPLDAKWAKKRLHAMYTDAEVCWTSSNDYAKRFLLKYGPKGLDLLEFQWICLPLAWQSGVSFDSGILISWDPDKENIWVQPMPTRDELHGFQPLHTGNLKTANAVPISSLSEKAAAFHRENGNVFTIDASEVFDAAPGASGPVEAVSNYGRGPTLPNFRTGCHEKEEQDDYSFYLSQTTWMIDDPGVSRDSIRNELMQRYDISHDVWVMKPAGPKGLERITTSLISLRAEESLDRRVILSQGEYSTGQYSRNQGCNVCSPVFDWTTSDIWRLFSATDFDVNDVYQKMYEAGIGVGDQRVGSLLNYAAVRQIATVKALEPDLYGRINARFSNVEFMAQFSRAGYFKIGKPRDSHWDGRNHLKAGQTPEEAKSLSDEYEKILQEFNVLYTRSGNEFYTNDPSKKGKAWFPLKEILENVQES